jgi:hypothetical protein
MESEAELKAHQAECDTAKTYAERDRLLFQVRAMQEIVDAAMNENMPRIRAATKAYQDFLRQTEKQVEIVPPVEVCVTCKTKLADTFDALKQAWCERCEERYCVACYPAHYCLGR